MKNLNIKYIILIVLGIILNFMFVRWNKTQVMNSKKTQHEIQYRKYCKDSLFSVADKIADSIDKKDKSQKVEIFKLKYELEKEKRNVKTKIVLSPSKPDRQEKVMAAGVDIRYIERELQIKEERLSILIRINRELNNKVDSLQSIIDKK